jgi:hypothetical protein
MHVACDKINNLKDKTKVLSICHAKALLDICIDSEREPLLIQEEESAISVALHRSTSQIPYYQTNEDKEFDNLNDVGLYI